MKTSIAILLLVSIAISGFADTVKFPAEKPFASITFPEGWEATVNGDTIAAKSEEGDALIDVIVTRPDMLGPSNDKAFAMLKVKPDFDSYKDTKSTINGMPTTVVTVDVKDSSGAAMKLTLTSLEVTKDRGLMFIQRGKGMEANKDGLTAILNSVAAEK
jgi:hypothetical protein